LRIAVGASFKFVRGVKEATKGFAFANFTFY
jgi:hypothetical protein